MSLHSAPSAPPFDLPSPFSAATRFLVAGPIVERQPAREPFPLRQLATLRVLGFTYRQMELDGCRLPVVEVRCRYKEPARYDEELEIKTHVQRVRSNLVHFVYEVSRAADGVLLAEGETVHLTQALDGSKRVFPPQYLQAMRRVAGR